MSVPHLGATLSGFAQPSSTLKPQPQFGKPSPATPEQGKSVPGFPWNPLDWNLSKIIPPLGILSSLAWGISNIAEHRIQDGHPPKTAWLNKLGQKAPWLNLIYGALNAVGAFAQGYSIRGLAFTAFTLFSAFMTRIMLKDNALSQKLTRQLGKKLTQEVAEQARQGLKLREWTSLYNAVAPIGLLTGLFSMTKVAQSSPDVELEHPKGNTLREMLFPANRKESLPTVLASNFKKEWGSFWKTISNTGSYTREALHDFRQAFRGLFSASPKQEDKGPAARFMEPITSGNSVPLFYAHATIGRVLASTIAALMFWRVNRAALLKSSIYNKLLGEAPQGSGNQAKWFNRALNTALIWGQLAGSPAGLFTQFNDWPIMLSTVYRTSGLAYGASALCALLSLGKIKSLGALYKDGKLLGFDERTWTKIGAFIQGTSYFVNLFIKNFQSDTKTEASTHQPSSPAYESPSTPASPFITA
jgi:hypothetical protein